MPRQPGSPRTPVRGRATPVETHPAAIPPALQAHVAEFLGALRSERRASENTVSAYRRDLEQLLTFAAERRPEASTPDELDVALLRGWLGVLARTHAPPSVARKIAAVRAFYRFLLRHGRATRDPARSLALPKVRRKLPTFLNVDAAKEVMNAPDLDGAEGLRDRALLELLYGSGLRVSELASLDIDHVDLERGEARVLGKGRKERLVPVGSHTVTAVRAYLGRRDELIASEAPALRALLLSKRGQRLSVRTIQSLVRRYGVLGAARGDLHPHALRHTCATHMLDGGADLRAIQEMLGHASLSTTQRYTHVSMDHILRVYDKAHPLATLVKRGDP